jgi:predicted transcriptional regulator
MDTPAAKQTVRELLDRLPEDCTLDDVLYHLYVVRSIEQGLVDADAGHTVPHSEVSRVLGLRWASNPDR